MDCLFHTTEELAEYLDGSCFEEDMYQFPEFVQAIVGISHDSRLVYSYTKLIQLIIEDSDGQIDEEGAIEHIDYNVIRTAEYLNYKNGTDRSSCMMTFISKNTINDMANETTAIAPLKQFNQFLANPRTQDYLTTVLAEKKASFVNNITALVSNNAALQVCKPDTLMFASLKATALDLPLDQNLGFAYVLPYKDNKTGVTSAQFQMGYKGFVQLALRSGQFKTLNATDVREGELIDEDFVTGELTFKKAESRESLPVAGYVAYFKLLNGFEKYLYMTVAEMKAHALRFSQTFKRGYGLWADKEMFDSMAKKTVLKLLLSKYAPLSVEMRDAIKADQAVMEKPDEYDYVDNQEPAQPEVSETAKQKAEEVKEKLEAMKTRRSKKETVDVQEPDADTDTGEIFTTTTSE